MSCNPCGVDVIFQDYEGEPGDAKAGRDYFRKRFSRLAQKAGRSKEREIYVQCVKTACSLASSELPFCKCNNGNGYGDAEGGNGCCRRYAHFSKTSRVSLADLFDRVSHSLPLFHPPPLVFPTVRSSFHLLAHNFSFHSIVLRSNLEVAALI